MRESTGEVPHGARCQAAPADGQRWDLLRGKSRRLSEQTLVRVRTRLTTWYWKLRLLQVIVEKLFKPWVSWKASGWWPFQAATAGKPGGIDFHRDSCCMRRKIGNIEYVFSNIYKTDDLRNSRGRKFHYLHFPNQCLSDPYNKQFLLFRL